MRRSTLAELIASFARSDRTASQAALFRGVGADLAASWDADLLNAIEALPPSRVSVYVDGATVDVFTVRPDRFGALHPALDRDEIRAAVESGATIVLQEVRGLIPCARPFAEALETAVHARVWVNVFAAFGDGGLSPHWDDNDVCVCQVQGTRVWFVSPPDPHDPVAQSRQVTTHSGACDTYSLEPGDFLVVPRGWIHSAEIASGSSRPAVHVMFAFRRPTGVDYLQWLARTAHELAIARSDVPLDPQLRGEWLDELRRGFYDLSGPDALNAFTTRHEADVDAKSERLFR